MIRLLDQHTIDQIAAGEVVERPCNVVKELLENAIDSGATRISVEIREGGLSLIRVSDNGMGIPQDEIRLAFTRHATSKLEDASGLSRISTMGFRGEALASICSVSETELVTKVRDALYGTRYEIAGGTERKMSEIGAPDGSTILVRNLFYNVPARKKFLKSAKSEGQRITDITEKLALSHPAISFSLISDTKRILETSGSGRLMDVIYLIYGRDTAGALIPIEESAGSLTIRGYLGRPVLARSRRDFEIFFVNGRYVRSPLLSGALEDAYKPYLMLHRFPFAVLEFLLPQELLDVNVHPQKTELRFSDPEAVYTALLTCSGESLRRTELIEPVSLDREKPGAKSAPSGVSVTPKRPPEPFEARRLNAQKEIRESFPSPVSGERTNAPFTPAPSLASTQGKDLSTDRLSDAPAAAYRAKEEEPRFLTRQAESYFKLIGQLFETYWLIEYQDKLYIIDQHAAHEKLNYERLMENYRTKSIDSQVIFPPVRLELSLEDQELLRESADAFSSLGYEITEEEDGCFLLTAVPANLYSVSERTLFMDILDGLRAEQKPGETPEIIRSRLASMSCKAAVKGSRPLSAPEMKALVSELLTLDNPYACPHGRPTIISISKYELDRKFRRIVSP